MFSIVIAKHGFYFSLLFFLEAKIREAPIIAKTTTPSDAWLEVLGISISRTGIITPSF